MQDLLPLAEYETVRNSARRRIIELKEYRRISVGEHVSLVFENRETIRFQVQEIMRAEHILDPERVREEIDTYNALLPSENELSATLLIEITDSAKVKQVLDTFLGIDEGRWVALYIGPQRVNGRFERGRSNEHKISAVHYVRFHIPTELFAQFRNPYVPVVIVIDHPHYHASTRVSMKTRFAFLSDLGLE